MKLGEMGKTLEDKFPFEIFILTTHLGIDERTSPEADDAIYTGYRFYKTLWKAIRIRQGIWCYFFSLLTYTDIPVCTQIIQDQTLIKRMHPVFTPGNNTTSIDEKKR